jgi:protein tyrosine phosphatase (PTP) superfamily phosphohydrolase (DUF442 family)
VTGRIAICCAALLLAGGIGCGGDDEDARDAREEIAGIEVGAAPAEWPGLHNVLRLTDAIYSGSEPHAEEGFASLASLGVKTVVSVDGAKPNVELARKHGLRYVHIPIGYDGVSKDAALSLARLVKEAEGPIYIHCHHGKHRGPAAAAVACIAAGEATGETAVEILNRSGTSKDYAGLWRDVQAFTPPASGAELPNLVETAQVGSSAAAMAQLDRGFDNLKLCRAASWQSPADHPDIVPAQEALLVREGLHEAGRHLADEYDQEFRAWLAEAESLASGLEQSLRDGQPAAAETQFAGLEQSCKRCHAKHRDR